DVQVRRRAASDVCRPRDHSRQDRRDVLPDPPPGRPYLLRLAPPRLPVARRLRSVLVTVGEPFGSSIQSMTALHEPTIATDELRPTYLEVDLERLAANYRVIARHVAPARVMPILKANAYGHGLVEVARKLEAIGAPYAGVAYLEEGIRIRQHGIRIPV